MFKILFLCLTFIAFAQSTHPGANILETANGEIGKFFDLVMLNKGLKFESK